MVSIACLRSVKILTFLIGGICFIFSFFQTFFSKPKQIIVHTKAFYNQKKTFVLQTPPPLPFLKKKSFGGHFLLTLQALSRLIADWPMWFHPIDLST
jgi:hypothetical protein